MTSGRRLRGISGERAVRTFVKLGYIRRAGKGSHVNLTKPGGQRLTIPLHKELSAGLLISQIKRAGIEIEDFIRILEG